MVNTCVCTQGAPRKGLETWLVAFLMLPAAPGVAPPTGDASAASGVTSPHDASPFFPSAQTMQFPNQT